MSLSDLPTFRELAQLRDVARTLAFGSRVVRPLLRVLGRDTSGVDEMIATSEHFQRQSIELESVSIRFTNLFVERGWIMYEAMDFPVAKRCVERAEAGEIDDAEGDLVAYYDVEKIRLHLLCMHAVQAFAPRMELAQKALADYEAGRFYASTLVVLSLLDGMVSDIHEWRQGIFANKNVELSAWDSLSANKDALGRLIRVLASARNKTRSEKISIPYRHGLMHGRDLGYDNPLVAAKAWAALFATREWAVRAEKGRLEQPAPRPERSFMKMLRDLADAKRKSEVVHEHLDAWRPRTMKPGVDCPLTGPVEEYAEGTPERAVVEALQHLMRPRPNYGALAEIYDEVRRSGLPLPVAARELREFYGSERVATFEILSIEDVAPAATEIEIRIRTAEAAVAVRRMRLVHEDDSGNASVRSISGGRWRPVSRLSLPTATEV